MLLSPFQAGECVDAGAAPVWWPAAAGHRIAHGVLTLPDVAAAVPFDADLSFTQRSVSEVVLAQLRAGPLSARDVKAPSSPGNAYTQALYKWFGRQHRPFRFLNLSFGLYDAEAVMHEIQHQYDAADFDCAAPLYLSVSSDGEGIYSLKGRSARLLRHHPQLLAIALRIIRRAAGVTAWIRMPDELFSEFAHWYWEGDHTITDEEARGCLADRFGEDEEEIDAYLPSAVKPEMSPDLLGLLGKARDDGRDRKILASLRTRPGAARLAGLLIALDELVRKARGRDLLKLSYFARPAYMACALIWEESERVSQVFDDIYELASNDGESTIHHGFIAIEQKPRAIRRQFADWQLALQILSLVDRVLGCITD